MPDTDTTQGAARLAGEIARADQLLREIRGDTFVMPASDIASIIDSSKGHRAMVEVTKRASEDICRCLNDPHDHCLSCAARQALALWNKGEGDA